MVENSFGWDWFFFPVLQAYIHRGSKRSHSLQQRTCPNFQLITVVILMCTCIHACKTWLKKCQEDNTLTKNAPILQGETSPPLNTYPHPSAVILLCMMPPKWPPPLPPIWIKAVVLPLENILSFRTMLSSPDSDHAPNKRPIMTLCPVLPLSIHRITFSFLSKCLDTWM